LIDGEENIVIRAEVPGVEKKDLEIAVDDATVTIKGKVIARAQRGKGRLLPLRNRQRRVHPHPRAACAVDGAKAAAHLKERHARGEPCPRSRRPDGIGLRLPEAFLQ